MKEENFIKFVELIEDTANETVLETIKEHGLDYAPNMQVNPNFVGNMPPIEAIIPRIILNNIADMFDEDSYKYIVRQFRNFYPSNQKECDIINDFFNKIEGCNTLYDILYCLFDHISMLPEAKFKSIPVACFCMSGEYDYKNKGLMYNLIFRKY